MRSIIFWLLCCLTLGLTAQECQISIKGKIIDPHDEIGLQYGLVYIEETRQSYKTDESGQFTIASLCAGSYHLRISHPGCVASKMFLKLDRDTFLTVHLEHHAHLLQTVDISGVKAQFESATSNTIRMHDLTQLSAKPLGSILEEFSGVNTIKNGTNIAKPVIHGLSGNRIGIYNQGIQLASQQWGADHAPELDPFSSQLISLVKGTDAVAYGGNHLGGVVLLDQDKIAKDPHLHGFHSLSYQSNGHQLGFHSTLERSEKKFDWRASIGLKAGGDLKTPEYYLSNTGVREMAGSFYVFKELKPTSIVKNYFSFFHTQLGILRGSHIGNLTDLTAAIGRDTPFFTKPDFTYNIESPSQLVSHFLNKFSWQKQQGSLYKEFNLAAQLNSREEYDVRRKKYQDAPSLHLLLQSYFAEYKIKKESGNRHWQTGIQQKFNHNYNVPGTGVSPLIPNYSWWNSGAFFLYKIKKENVLYEAGARYDFIHYIANIPQRSVSQPAVIKSKTYHNLNSVLGISTQIIKNWEIKLQSGFSTRTPEINELFSFGLHQSVAGIEEGNPGLHTERSFKTILTQSIHGGESWVFEISPYYQWVQNYIYLQPQAEYRLTIRGAFPVFKYEQTDVRIYGFDLTNRVEIFHHWSILNRFSMVEILRQDLKQILVGTPAPQILNSLSYHWEGNKILIHPKIQLNARYVWQRTGVVSEADFLDPPKAYFLLGAEFNSEFRIFNHRLNCILRAENLLNHTYRDYLNRLRYYANDVGRNVSVVLRMEI
ncbi:MAG: TonB-dependent receptor [Saprospiraceae bacterium]|nr:TonB-dependent receptor [Saprospiraceae bacterium]MBK9630097.1 TonB-dependent receptor [Saprospiraceae bacterium]